MKYKSEITQEEFADNPRNWDNITKMICFHGSYDLGDNHDINPDDFAGWDEMEEHICKEFDVVRIMPLYLYDHSGISISTSREYPFNCPWDSGQVGFVFITAETAMREYGYKNQLGMREHKHLTDLIDGEVNLYNQYLTGDVWSCVITDEDDEVVDCDSIYGYDEAESTTEGMLARLNGE